MNLSECKPNLSCAPPEAKKGTQLWTAETPIHPPAQHLYGITPSPHSGKLAEQLAFISVTARNGAEIYDFIVKHGREFNYGRTADKLGRMTTFYRTAALGALANADWTYVEGFASWGQHRFPVEHAWCVEQTGLVVELTWPSAMTSIQYFGVPFQRAFFEAQMAKSLFLPLLDRHPLSELEQRAEIEWKGKV